MASTIPPVREIVMVITDLYLAAPEDAAALAGARLPGIEQVARFAARTPLGAGWRSWLAQHLGRSDLAAAAPAAVAAAAATITTGSPRRSQWIATPVHLSAGLSRVHLDHRGILRLEAPAAAGLAASFAATFQGSGLELVALPCGEFLLRAEGIEAVPVGEPERCAGADISASLPHGPAAAGLRRSATEIEMWLHGLTGVTANALWLWGAQGTGTEQAPLLPRRALRAFGADAYLDGLARLQGARCEPLPQDLAGLIGTPGAEVVLALRVGGELQNEMVSFVEGLGRLDARFIAPALAALRAGAWGRLSLIANDTLLSMQRGSALKRWRRARSAAAAFT